MDAYIFSCFGYCRIYNTTNKTLLFMGRGAPNVLSWWSSQCVVRVEHSCPQKLLLAPRFLDIVVDVDVTGPPHISKLWLGVNSDLLPVKYFHPKKSFVCVSCILWRSKDCHKPEVKLAIVHFCGIFPDFENWCMSVSMLQLVCHLY